MTTSLTADELLDLLDDPAQIASANSIGPVWVTTDRHLRAQAALYARDVALYEQQISTLLDLIRLPRTALTYRGSRLLGLAAPRAAATVGAPLGWVVKRDLLVPSGRQDDVSATVAHAFAAVTFRPDPATFIDGFPPRPTGVFLAGNGALVFASNDESAAPVGDRWEQVPVSLWTQVRQYAAEDLAASAVVPHPNMRP